MRKERKQFVLAFENVFRRFNGVIKLAAAAASDCFIVFDFITRQWVRPGPHYDVFIGELKMFCFPF